MTKFKRIFFGVQLIKKKLHLANWNLVTTKKSNRGLGLKKTKTKNLSLLANLAWRLASNTTNLWALNMLRRYSQKPSDKGSFIWKNIIKGWKIFQKGMSWSIYSSSSLNLWENKWIPNSNNLRSYMIGPLTKKESSLKIRDIRLENSWNWTSRTG